MDSKLKDRLVLFGDSFQVSIKVLNDFFERFDCTSLLIDEFLIGRNDGFYHFRVFEVLWQGICLSQFVVSRRVGIVSDILLDLLLFHRFNKKMKDN